MVGEFRDFIKQGNVMQLAVGVIIGGAFGKIVASLTDDVLMPVISLATGKVDFGNLFVPLDGNTYATLADAKKATAAIAYGNFINAVINFLIIAFVIFIIVKQVNRLMPPPAPAPPPGPTPTETLLTEIRDLLKK
jgi:large conductance mechanosensitive channel